MGEKQPYFRTIGSSPDPFLQGAYTAGDKALRGNYSVVYETSLL